MVIDPSTRQVSRQKIAYKCDHSKDMQYGQQIVAAQNQAMQALISLINDDDSENDVIYTLTNWHYVPVKRGENNSSYVEVYAKNLQLGDIVLVASTDG